ncbi:hypothetical protein [uncultured Roseobacter sp.]|uniref:hypothetical protein n=1 Tax=uncultured Roseobacter sp. TaxID=114847 RepID=UPI00262FC09D|nr:hypothetical protein [uncultured Roseobacter sp.]
MHNETPQADHISLIVGRLSSYLDKLAGQVFDIEEAIGQTLSNNSVSNKNAITDLQALDFLRQSLEDLALMTLLLSDCGKCSVSASMLGAIGDKLKLRTTRLLLDGHEPNQFGHDQESLGDLDLF